MPGRNRARTRVDVSELFKRIARQLQLEFEATEQSWLFAFDRGLPREEAIKSFLADKLPKKYGVGGGLIVSSGGEQSRQCDVVIHDADRTAILHSGGPLQVFPAESVYAVVEVKSSLTPTSLDDAIENIKAYKSVPRNEVTTDSVGSGGVLTITYAAPRNPKQGCIFAYTLGSEFTRKSNDAVRDIIVEAINRQSPEHRIDFVCIADRWMMLPIPREDSTVTLELFQSRESPELIPAFFLAYLVDVLDEISLERLRLWKYLIAPQTSPSTRPNSQAAATAASSSTPRASESTT